MTELNLTSINLIKRKETINLGLFSVGKFISIFGTSIYTFAIGLYVLKLTGSGLSFATNLVVNMIPIIIINPIGGVLADRVNRKLLVILMDFLSGILLMIVYFISASQGLTIIMIYISTFILSMLTALFDISSEAAKPNMVSEEKLMNINSVSKIIASVSSILGPTLGGIAFAFMDIKLFILINGVSFIFSAILEIFIDFKLYYTPSEKEDKKVSFTKDMKEGFKYVSGSKQIVSLCIVFITLNFFLSLSLSVPLPFIINNVLKLSPKNFGIIEAAFPVGMILGALFVKKINDKLSYKKLLLTMNLIIAAGTILIGLPVLPFNFNIADTVFVIYYALVVVLIGISIALIDISISFLLQKNTSDEYRGRVMGIVVSMVKIIAPVAYILSGVLMNLLPPYLLSISGGTIFLLLNFKCLSNKTFYIHINSLDK